MDAIGGVRVFLFPVYVDWCSFSDDEGKIGIVIKCGMCYHLRTAFHF